MATLLAILFVFPVLISANIVIPFERIVKHDQHQNNAPSFSLEKHTDPEFYTVKMRLGNPSKEFTLLLDTGTDDLWVSCKSNNGCPNSNKNIRDGEQNIFDPATSSLLSCNDPLCSHCSENKQCTYDTHYTDKDSTSGYYLKDMLFFDQGANLSAPFVFGCSTNCNGNLHYRGVDGYLGLARGSTSFVSQLSALHKIPKVFSHCLRADGGGGKLIFGKISNPHIVYSPINQTLSHYIINVDSIFVGEKELPIAGEYSQVEVDSGASSGLLVSEIYDSLVDAISATAPKYATPNPSEKSCYDVPDSSRTLNQIFPTLSYKFKGGLTIVLRPEEYFAFKEGQYKTWCINLIRVSASDSINIIGDIFFRDKIVVYDNDQQRIGMANYNCSSPIVVDNTSNILKMMPLQLYYILTLFLIMHHLWL